ncbi:MAG: 16S rRNA (guanine(527)-N(7))-methyltransferase RsmG [Rhizobiaceae bacterium]|nr:16S rRNA (guanine(527)-N(7))-methyltransferase RsmG [Rhizobiaceae bacterium]
MKSELIALERVVGPVSRETFAGLLQLQGLFRKWAARINLVAPSTLSELWMRHVVDSAQLLPLARGAKRWMDLGSGGGFPALVVATFLKQCADASVDLIESNAKKAAFLQTAVRELALPAKVHVRRIEEIAGMLPNPEIVTARALAPLPILLELAYPLFSSTTRALFHKGRDYRRELEESADDWRFDLIERPSAVERGSVILEILNLQRRKE